MTDSQRGRPVRVLMVCPRFLPEVGGTEAHTYEVARRLNATGNFEVTVLTTDRTRQLPPKEVIDGVPVVRVPSYPRNRDYYIAPQLPAAIRQQQLDIIHCQGIHNPVPVQAMRTAQKLGVPYVLTFHTGGHSSGLRNAIRSTQWRLIGPLLRKAARLIAVSQFEADAITRQAGLREKPVVIRNGGALPPPRAGAAPVTGRIVSTGRLERYKGHHRVIEALPYVMQEIPEAHLLILGSGAYKDELLALARRLGVADRVQIKYLEPADRTGMATALAEASVVAALSDYEAHPVAVMEALCVGRPVVGYDVAGVGDLVAEGWVRGVPFQAPAADVAKQLVDVMTSPAPPALAQIPTWDSCAEEVGRVYMSSLKNFSGPSVPDAPASAEE
jgi:glycosyltransferase involved in cell wall biosynthesis